LPNVYHIGPVDWWLVPHYVKGFDVGLMPYLQNRHAQNISPMKLYDYLAASIPIASLDFPSARGFSRYIHLADSPQAFPQAVCAALADTTPEHRQARIELASQNSWEARVEEVSNIIQVRLQAKQQWQTGKQV
jgi:hypothetical protein